jgi:D-glycero-alpha-D-manno-heptose-7-phosphate kinase
MIISKTPFRISFAGGLSDIGDYYQKNYGAVTSTSIDKYVYLIVNKRFGNDVQINYSKAEIVQDVSQIQHPMVREALKLVNINSNIEITVMSDIPARTGLGSSSSFAVGLLNALYAYKGKDMDAERLAQEACRIEIDILKEPIGKQDQYASSYGGLNYIRFNSDETVDINPINMNKEKFEELDNNLLLFYTGITRYASSILNESKNKMEEYRNYVDQLRDLAKDVETALKQGDLTGFGRLLHKGWTYKKKTGNVTNPQIDKYYDKALKAGAIGGKILGAGGGGFLLLYCEESYQEKVRKSLSGLKEVIFNLKSHGSKIVFKED